MSEELKDYRELVQDGDFVLCRTNAPLISECFKFLKRGIRANIQGRDIGQGLIALVNKMKTNDIRELTARLSDWLHAETGKENAKRNPSEAKLTALADKHDCLMCFIEGAANASDVVRKIETIFTDDRNGVGIRLSSIHRAKGLEASRVFYLQPKGTGPRRDKMQEWELRSEENLRYVAITRAIHELVMVS